MVTSARLALGFVACWIAAMLLRPAARWLDPIGEWSPLLWFGPLLVVADLVLIALERAIGGVPYSRRCTRAPQ
jgi:hypothetical protein